MSVGQSFMLALKSLTTSKMRAFLTMLGIIIGVGAVIVIISLGDGMRVMMNESFESIGSNLLMVNIYGRGSSRNMTTDEMYALADKYPEYVAYISPSVSVRTSGIKYGSETFDTTSVTGVGESYDKIRNYKIADGRFIQYIDVSRLQTVCVVGSYVDKEILEGNSIGKTVKIAGINYTVVGVLDEKSNSEKNGDDDIIFIPYSNATRINKNSSVTTYYVSAVNDSVNAKAKWVFENALHNVYQDSDYYYVMSMSEMLEIANTMQSTLMTVLIAIAGISLLVGGIGIMNIMLVSVTERTKEIGIRKSLGAKKRDIRLQFIIEAGTTSAVGGVIGIFLGISLANFAGGLIGINSAPSVIAISVAFGVSVGIGMIFGYLPANKAAKLNPIDALRYD